jgi:uncharacterized membrane protein YdjX (TVP38/TMEM64 family)
MATRPSSAGEAKKPITWGRWVLAAGLILGIVGFYAFGLDAYFSWDFVREHLDAVKAWVQENQVLALGVGFLVYVTMAALSLPAAAILSLVVGAVFGRWVGTGLVSVAATLGATLAFLSSRYLFRDWVQQRFGKRLVALDRGLDRDGAYYLFTLRLVPLFPFFLINLGMGLTRLPVRTFAWVSWVGMLPGTFLYINAGAELGSLDSPRDVLSPGILVSFALLGVVPLLLRMTLLRGQEDKQHA